MTYRRHDVLTCWAHRGGAAFAVCDEPQLIEVTWEFGGDVSWVDATLAPAGGGTDLTIAHTAEVPPEFWDQYGARAAGIGWEMAHIGSA